MSQSTTRKFVSAFGMLFKDIEIRDWDETTNRWKKFIRVPIAYGPKDKWIEKIMVREQSFQGTGSGFDDDVAITLPRIAFQLTGVTYDSSRTLNKKNFYTSTVNNNGNIVSKQQVGIPYDYSFDIYVLVKYAEHGTKIIEQILPFFSPELNISLKLTGEENISIDVPVILTGISLDDSYEDDFIARRVITWTLNFTMKGMVFAPEQTHKIIKTAITGLGVGDSLFKKNTTIPTMEGKTLDEILATDDFGYSEVTEYIYE
jgi:hypothetical protein